MKKEIIESTYKIISDYHQKYLKQHGVKLPKLYDSKRNYTKGALVLIYLANDYPNTKEISKKELTNFIRKFYPETNDIQQARHLGAQDGWFIKAGTRGDPGVKKDYYKLHTLEKPYPGFKKERRTISIDSWEEIKQKYDFRCTTCGSKEGESHFHWPSTITTLNMAHMDPAKPLEAGNIIPQCEKCNKGDRNRWVYDEKGRVVKLSNPEVIKFCDEDVRKKVYRILYSEFKGRNPDSII